MQFNFVVSTNEKEVRFWKSFGFEIVGCLPEAFLHPVVGYTNAYVMYRVLPRSGRLQPAMKLPRSEI